VAKAVQDSSPTQLMLVDNGGLHLPKTSHLKPDMQLVLLLEQSSPSNKRQV
jgi:hypothetical protein